MTIPAAWIRSLAALAETHGSARAALASWYDEIPGARTAPVSKRARMGAPLDICLAPLGGHADAALVIRAVTAHAAHGGSLARTLASLADAIEQRAAAEHESRAAAAASKLSARLLAGLALVCAVVAPLWQRASPLAVVVTAGAALALAALGMTWMRKLRPVVPAADDPAAAAADLLAELLDAGLPLGPALEVASPPGVALMTRWVRLGMSWTDALAHAGHEGLARVLRVTYGRGLPPEVELRRLARSLRDERRRACEIEAKRAPVLLILPLVLCFLPAFALVMVVPLLHALAR